MPGAAGFAARRALYPLLLGGCGRGVIFGQHVVLRHPHKIRVADSVAVDDNCLLDAKGDGNAGIELGRGVFVGRNSILSCKNGDIVLGAGANVGFNCEIFSAARVSIGPGTLLAAYCYVIGGDHDLTDPSRPVLEQGRRARGVTIGAGAWLGAGVKVLDGVTIGDGAIVGAGAVVRSDVPAGAIAVGLPARVIGHRDQAPPRGEGMPA
jgi:acetyltransferase-like isoleucine patch superfamily enzyme